MRSLLMATVRCCILLATLLGRTGIAQERSTLKSKVNDTVRLSLGSVSGVPGESVSVPVYFTPEKGVRVQRLSIRVRFVSVNLKLEEVEPGIAAGIENTELHHDLNVERDDKGLETSTLDLQISSPDTTAGGIPSGLLAFLQMRISAGARLATIALRTTAEATEIDPSRRAEIVLLPDATVEVIAPGSEPAVVCFFFTH